MDAEEWEGEGPRARNGRGGSAAVVRPWSGQGGAPARGWVVGCMEEKLADEAMTPAGLLLITGDEQHMMVMPSSLKISPSMVTKMKAWGTMNPTPRLAVVLFLVAMVIIMAIVIRMTVTTKRE